MRYDPGYSSGFNSTLQGDPSLLTERILDLADRLPGASEQAATDSTVQEIAGEFAHPMVEQMRSRARQCFGELERATSGTDPGKGTPIA